MITVLAIGDPHFKVGNVAESIEMTDKLTELSNNVKPTFIVCLGDILHKHETIHVAPLMRAEEMIRRLSEISPTFVVVGNHDRPNNSNFLTDEHPFNAMKKWHNTYVSDKVMDVTVGSERFLFVPYVPPGKFMDALLTKVTKENPLENICAIFAHQEFYGAKMGAIQSQAGDRWPENNPLVISGHIHDYDRLQNNIIYVGTPMQHAFGDKSDKTVSIFRFKSEEEWTEERVDLGLIKRIIVYLTVNEIESYEPPTDKLVKIVVKGTESEIKAISHLSKIKDLRKNGIKVVFKPLTNRRNQKIVLRMRYKDRLFSKIQSDTDQIFWFNRLFN